MTREPDDYDWALGEAGVAQHLAFDARALVKRQLAWDMLPHHMVAEVLANLGMIPAGPDVAHLEHQDAHRRMLPFRRLQADLWPALDLATEVISGAMLEDHDEDCHLCLDEDVIRDIIRASVIGVLAHLLNEQVVLVNDKS